MLTTLIGLALMATLSGCAALLLAIPAAPHAAVDESGNATGGGSSASGGSGSDSDGSGSDSSGSDYSDERSDEVQIAPHTDGDLSFYRNLVKQIGEPAVLYDRSGRIPLATMEVLAITPDPLCTNTPAHVPSNGHYVELQLRVRTTAALGQGGIPVTISFSRALWFSSVPLWNGGSRAIGTDDRCDLAEPTLPDRLGASQEGVGALILDVSEPSDVLAFHPNVNEGYEWDFARPASWTATAPPPPTG